MIIAMVPIAIVIVLVVVGILYFGGVPGMPGTPTRAQSTTTNMGTMMPVVQPYPQGGLGLAQPMPPSQPAMDMGLNDAALAARASLPPGGTSTYVAPVAPVLQKSMAAQLLDLKVLLDDGVLSQEEFAAEKTKILAANRA